MGPIVLKQHMPRGISHLAQLFFLVLVDCALAIHAGYSDAMGQEHDYFGFKPGPVAGDHHPSLCGHIVRILLGDVECQQRGEVGVFDSLCGSISPFRNAPPGLCRLRAVWIGMCRGNGFLFQRTTVLGCHGLV